MLLVDRKDRDHAEDVSKRVGVMFSKCQENRSYALHPGTKELEDTKQKKKRKRVVDNSSHNGGSRAHQDTQEHTKRRRQARR